MTPPAAPTLHQKRCVLSCDSCGHAEKTNSQSYPFKCLITKPVPMMVHEYCVSWFGYVGCASHSSTLGADTRQSANIPTELPEEMPFTPDEIPQKKFVITESEFRKMFDAWMFSTKDVRELHAIQNKVQSRAISIGHTSGCDCARCHTYKTSGYYLCEECYAAIALLKDGVK